MGDPDGSGSLLFFGTASEYVVQALDRWVKEFGEEHAEISWCNRQMAHCHEDGTSQAA
ncbi:hypothetical protein AB0M23_30310 [Streptomyces sp. NPDC052077]|uniref:hypothetical protein n=1 Tax=Streptomyces sp. NPDC052077 TaxID=3154757 RepID=UPI0034222E72